MRAYSATFGLKLLEYSLGLNVRRIAGENCLRTNQALDLIEYFAL